ncbi:MAG: Na+/H+ antiporter subunit E [Gammaproteobacteria bacterium]|nr:Na+/H+ antiporter subunit E [Gammaproteobacteria bacterium]MBU0828051.1 Na+/H+ antiporter subunit E [Gammaproteobacteria bacterium]MBU0889540.1 Na+/H+ antiporter subunit E [Gammaproteobacteria bacterium]MBU1818828.1 Na+/H+ antiporter subunit E [Gammaproteobacteria bacterium]
MSKKQRWLTHPWLSVLLAITWLLLQHSVSVFHVLSGVLIGLIVPRLLKDFLPAPRRLNMRAAVRLGGVVLWDIVVSNITVARLVLGPMSRMQPAWVPVPLTLTHPTAIALLATIITTTPGTVSCTIDEERHEILVHALNCDDPAQMAADIKSRYETPLLAIFEAAQPTDAAIQGDRA